MTRVLIVDDHPMVARYTSNEVVALRPEAAVLLAASLEEAESLVGRHGPPDYVLLDLMLPDCYGLRSLVRLRELAANAIIAIVSAEASPSVMRDCFAQGARGYVTKSTGADDFTEALRKLFENGFFYPATAAAPPKLKFTCKLTRRELEVLQVLATGRVNKQLAPSLGISESTLKTYLRSIFAKLAVRTRLEAVRRGVELGIIDPSGRR